MKLILVLWLGSVAALHAITASTTLTFASQPGFNVITVTITPQAASSLGDSDTTTLTGGATATLNIDPQTGTTTELTLTNGRLNGTPMSFSRSIIIVGGYNLNVTNFSAAVDTILPPGLVTPANGQFAASQHRFVIDQGNVTGSTSGFLGNNAINETFSPQNTASGTGTGTGTVVLTPAGDTGIYRNYAVTVTLPIQLADTLDANGLLVDVSANGTLKATGTVQVPRTEYLAWTATQNQPGASFTADPDRDGIPHGILWALGLAANANPRPHLPQPDTATLGGFIIPLPSTGTTGPILVECSTNLTNWSPAPLAGGIPNPIPAGTTGSITIPPTAPGCGFVRMVVVQP
ncbi:MAG: hypothetical protein JNG86_15485 [Verrucomicrobiaceae bacterium]|nr:hypothetical protein [Verrucomicrobiaceae bacterium]